jgi:hypothetical protein
MLYGNLVKLPAIWYVLWQYGIFCDHPQENLATMITRTPKPTPKSDYQDQTSLLTRAYTLGADVARLDDCFTFHCNQYMYLVFV